MLNNDIRKLTDKEILTTIRNEASLNRINALVSIDVIKGAAAKSEEHQKQLDENLAKYEGSLKRFNELLDILDKKIADI